METYNLGLPFGLYTFSFLFILGFGSLIYKAIVSTVESFE